MDLISLADRYYAPGDPNRKGNGHLIAYERNFSHCRNSKLSILEIGINKGSSLRLWREYFPNALIVGLDIKPVFVDLPDVHVVCGDQSDPRALDHTMAAIRGMQFDIIIDDASHIGLSSKAAFSYLFPRGLKPGGVYVVEDYCAPFLPGWPDGAPLILDNNGLQSYQHGMVGFLKQLIDHLAMTTPAPKLAISEITFHSNIAFIRKADA